MAYRLLERMNVMTRGTNLAATAVERDLIITRTINAPRELVFKAWTEPEHMALWWGPQGFTNPVCEMEVRPGGAVRIDMRGPDGTVYPMKGIFHEVVPQKRLVFTSSAFEDERGGPRLVTINTVTFTGMGSKTRITLQAGVVKSTPAVKGALAGMEEGWKQSFDRLDELLEKS